VEVRNLFRIIQYNVLLFILLVYEIGNVLINIVDVAHH